MQSGKFRTRLKDLIKGSPDLNGVVVPHHRLQYTSVLTECLYLDLGLKVLGPKWLLKFENPLEF